LYRITGIDWAQVNGIDVLTAQTVIAESGADLSAFPSEKNFTSWLGLCPTNQQSGGKILKRRSRKVVNRAATALRNAATTLLRAKAIWARNTAAYAPVSAPRKRSPPWPES
jgi:transposase